MAARIKAWINSGIAAFQLLTRFPMPVQIPFDEPTLTRSVVWYPAVGLAVGAIAAAAGVIAVWLLPPLPAAAVVTAVWAAITGGLHLDGLMDSADGLLSHRSRERMLEIMKDSRVGAMGVIVCVLQLLLKTSLLTVWTEHARSDAWFALMLVPVWSRTFMTAAVAHWPYARSEGGLGGILRGVHTRHAVAALVLAAVIAASTAAAGVIKCGGTVTSIVLETMVLGAVTYSVGGLFAARISSKLGGLTGDTYGALNELLETVLLMVLAIAIHLGML